MAVAARRSYPSNSVDIGVRVRGEYREMPGLALTLRQAQRLWALDGATCQRVLQELVETRFLRRTATGRYVRADGEAPARHFRLK
jgi:hypothetical protein